MKSIKNFLPKDKGDIDSVERLKDCTFTELEPIIPDLLTWLQDGNWPVAGPVSDLLEPYADKLSDNFVDILKDKDDIWKYWILLIFIKKIKNSGDKTLKMELQRIVDNPTKGEIEEGVSELANEIVNE